MFTLANVIRIFMTFNHLVADANCTCLEEAHIDNATQFAIKTNKDHLRDVDFKTYWEKGKRPENDNCDEICSYKGQSINILNTETALDETFAIYKELFQLSPTYRPHCAVITLLENSGLVKATPLDFNPLHYDFYKCDNFTLDLIQSHSITFLGDV